MIATILPGSSTFHAVDYNEKKVKEGKADLLEMSGFGFLQNSEFATTSAIKDYLIKYSERNKNIKNTQFHVAISCKGDSYTPEQLTDIAHQWLKEMGYGDPKQPVLIYAHHDTKNTHIHIVTSRVDPNGHKIDHNNERRRSQTILNKIMGVDRKQDTKDIIKNAFTYSFATLGQFQAVLESSGYECYKEDDELNVKKDGVVQEHIKIADIESRFKKMDKEATAKRRKQLKAILAKYRDLSSNKEELRETMKKKFGIDIIFNGKKDSPYGYMLVDHNEKIVYKGSDVLPIKELLHFTEKKEQSPEDINSFIKSKLEENPDISTFEMSQLLRKKFNAYITTGEEFTSRNEKKSGVIIQGHKQYALEQDMYEKLKYNGRMKWMQSFHPSSEEEKSILIKFGHIEEPDKIHVEPDRSRAKIEITIANINNILGQKDSNVFDEFHKEKLILYRQEDKYFVLDMKNKTIVNLQQEGIDTTRLAHAAHEHEHKIGMTGNGRQTSSQNKRTGINASQTGKNIKNVLKPEGGHSANREWEVGSDDRWDEVDNQLKR